MRRGDSFIANAIALHCVGQSDGAVWCSTNKNERLGDHLVAFTWDGRVGLPQNSGNGPQPFRCTTVNLRLKKKKFKVFKVGLPGKKGCLACCDWMCFPSSEGV